METTTTRPNNLIPIDFFSVKRKEELPPPLPNFHFQTVGREIETVGDIATWEAEESILKPETPKDRSMFTVSANWAEFKPMRSKYEGKCLETGNHFEAGEWILYNFERKTVYHASSCMFLGYIKFLLLVSKGEAV